MKKLHILLAAAAVLVVAAGASFAAIPSSSGTISACKDNKGVLKAIDAEAGQTCPNNQQLLTWSQQGPAGPQGPAGISGYEKVTASDEAGPNASHAVATHYARPARRSSVAAGTSGTPTATASPSSSTRGRS